AVHIAADAVGAAAAAHVALASFGFDFLHRQHHVREPAAPLQFLPVHNVPELNVARFAGIGDVELSVIGREANAVWFGAFVGHHFHFANLRVDAIDGLFDFQFALMAFIIGHRAVTGVGEPDAAVGMPD